MIIVLLFYYLGDRVEKVPHSPLLILQSTNTVFESVAAAAPSNNLHKVTASELGQRVSAL